MNLGNTIEALIRNLFFFSVILVKQNDIQIVEYLFVKT